MRTTLTLDDELAAALKKRAYETGRSFKEVVNEALRDGLQAGRVLPRPERYTLDPVALGEPLPGIDLDKALRIAAELEDDEASRKMQLRK